MNGDQATMTLESQLIPIKNLRNTLLCARILYSIPPTNIILTLIVEDSSETNREYICLPEFLYMEGGRGYNQL